MPPLIFTADVAIKKNLRFEDHVTSSTQADFLRENRSLIIIIIIKFT